MEEGLATRDVLPPLRQCGILVFVPVLQRMLITVSTADASCEIGCPQAQASGTGCKHVAAVLYSHDLT